MVQALLLLAPICRLKHYILGSCVSFWQQIRKIKMEQRNRYPRRLTVLWKRETVSTHRFSCGTCAVNSNRSFLWCYSHSLYVVDWMIISIANGDRHYCLLGMDDKTFYNIRKIYCTITGYVLYSQYQNKSCFLNMHDM